MGENVHSIVATNFNSMKTIKFALFILLILAMHSLYAQDSLNVKWLGSCLGCASRNVASGEIGGSTYLFVSQEGSVMVLDVDDPTKPQKVVEIGHPGATGKTVIVDTFLYVPIGRYGLWIYNIANPYAPARIGQCKTADARCVAVSGDYAYVADGDSGIVIIDVSQPSTPVPTSFLHLDQARCVDIVVSDSFAFIAGLWKFLIVNVADPFAPALTGSWNPHYAAEQVRAVAVQGNFAYLANHGLGFWVVDVTNPESPVSADSVFHGLALDIDVCGDHAYGAAEDTGIVIINITNPHNAFIVGTLNTPCDAVGISASDGYAYVADLFTTRIIDVSNPSNPVDVGFFDNLDSFAQDVAISDTYAYVAYGEDGLRIVDISNPFFPYEVGYWDTPDIARGVAVSGDYAYVADADSGLRVIDVSNPYLPYEVGRCDTMDWVDAVYVSGNYAYCGNRSLKIVDISNPYAPFLVSVLPTDYASSVVKEGKYVYLAGSIIDVSNPYAPYEIGTFPTALGIAVSMNKLYILEPFHIFDISDPSSPVGLSSLNNSGWGIVTYEDYVVIGSGIYFIDITDSFNPTVVGYYAGGGTGIMPTGRLKVSDDNVYVTSGHRGLHIFRFTGGPGIEEDFRASPQSKRLVFEIRPNPFTAYTTISFDIERVTENSELRIFDCAGKLVKDLSHFIHNAPCPVSILWNGTDDYGRKIASGIYFCCFSTDGHNETQKLVHLK